MRFRLVDGFKRRIGPAWGSLGGRAGDSSGISSGERDLWAEGKAGKDQFPRETKPEKEKSSSYLIVTLAEFRKAEVREVV